MHIRFSLNCWWHLILIQTYRERALNRMLSRVCMCIHSIFIIKIIPPDRKSQCACLYECEWICAYLHSLWATVRYSCVFSFLSENISMWLWANTHTQALSSEFVRKRKLLLFHMIAKHTDTYIHTHTCILYRKIVNKKQELCYIFHFHIFQHCADASVFEILHFTNFTQ